MCRDARVRVAGVRCVNKSSRKASSPAGGCFKSSTSPATWSALRGFGTIPSAARSSICLRYSVSTIIVLVQIELNAVGGSFWDPIHSALGGGSLTKNWRNLRPSLVADFVWVNSRLGKLAVLPWSSVVNNESPGNCSRTHCHTKHKQRSYYFRLQWSQGRQRCRRRVIPQSQCSQLPAN